MQKIIIFTDGSSFNNGKPNVSAGYSIYCPTGEIPSFGKPLFGKELSNQKAELMAIVSALKLLLYYQKQEDEIIIYSDSLYAINCLTVWWHKWIVNDWKNASNLPVKNLDLILEGIEAIKCFSHLTFKHIRGHSKDNDSISIGNNIADMLAVQGNKLNKTITLNFINDNLNDSLNDIFTNYETI